MYWPDDLENNRHICDDRDRLRDQSKGEEVEEYYGEAVVEVLRLPDGRWIAENGEFASFIRFCPFCGKKLD